jgi:hypothetical protein
MWMNSVFSDSDRQKLAGGKEKGKKKAYLAILQSLFKALTVLRPIWIPY